jgi:streptogramin lyase
MQGKQVASRNQNGLPGGRVLPRTLSRAIFVLAVVAAGLPGLAAAQGIDEFPIPTSGAAPFGITAGPDGELWFTERAANKIGRITLAGVFTEFPVPTASSDPRGITAGSDGNLWFTEELGNNVCRMTTAGVITEFPIPTAGVESTSITAGPDGNLWFVEETGNQVGRSTTAGVITEFPIPTAASRPAVIAPGSDGNLWFTELVGNNIGRITTAGVFTEFPVPTATSQPGGIAAGPDGNLWFTEIAANKIGRITTAGVITEFPIPTAASLAANITAGPDGNLWFTEESKNKIGRITTAGVITEFPIPTPNSVPRGITTGPDGNVWFVERLSNKVGRMRTGPLVAQGLAVDSAGNGVFEPGETVLVAPSWTNSAASPLGVTGVASNFTGPAGPTYTIADGAADYGTIAAGATADCASATANCYSLGISAASRPADHWDVTFEETLSDNTATGWTLHVGNSFTDVPNSDPFYSFIETIFHKGVTAGCGAGIYCPTNPVTRAQMAVFLLKGEHGAAYTPPACAGVFSDVVCPTAFAVDWIERLSAEGITAGCGGGNYCPDNPVTRAQMAVFLLKAEHTSAYVPPACTGVFSDVVCPTAFAVDWIERLAAEGITGGCGAGIYCPNNPVTRGQMAVFLTKTFSLLLYGP